MKGAMFVHNAPFKNNIKPDSNYFLISDLNTS